MTQGGFEFWIDGTKVSDPINWKEFTETIEFDDQLKVFTFKYENKLKFSGTAYSYLYGKRNAGGICYVADVTIKRSCSGGIMKDIMKGKIFVADCLFFISNCVVECSLHDNNYSAMVFNNKNIKVPLNQSESKNKGIQSPFSGLGLTYLNTVTGEMKQVPNYFNPVGGGVVLGIDTHIFFLHDVFNYLIAWLTDGQCTFKSDYLNWTLPIVTDADSVKRLTICSGHNIRVYGLNEQSVTSVSFEQLFKEVNRLYPIILSVEYDGSGKPVIRIEDEASTRLTSSSITLNALADVKEKSDNSLLFGSVHVGSPSSPYNPSIHTYPPASNITFVEENYYLTGYCNTSTEKDLFGEFICDTNVIEELILTNTTNTSYDSNIFFLEVDPASVTFGGLFASLKTVNFDNATNYHFNENLLNINAVTRHQFHNNIAGTTGSGGTSLDNFSISASPPVNMGLQTDCSSSSMPPTHTGAYSVLTFDIDNPVVFDGVNYTAQISGSYSFHYDLQYNLANDHTAPCSSTFPNRKVTVETKVERYNSFNVLQETQNFVAPTTSAEGLHLYSFNATFTMLIGDYIKASSRYSSHPDDFLKTSAVIVTMFYGATPAGFQTTSTPAYPGEIYASSGLNYLCNVITFNNPLPQSTYETLKANINKSILWNIDGLNNRKAWIKRVTRNTETSETEWELISDINNSQ